MVGLSSRALKFNCGDVRCVMLLGARMADTGSVNGPAASDLGFDVTSLGTS